MDPVLLEYVKADQPTPAVKTTESGAELVLTRNFPVSQDRLWAALTAPSQQRLWTPCVSDRELNSVGPAMMQESADGQPVKGDVTICDIPHLLTHYWDEDVLAWSLTVEGQATVLRLDQQTTTRDAALMCAAGWHICLATLGGLLDGHDVPAAVGPVALEYGWAELKDRYEELSKI